jgi:DNA-binding NtrC family response regulator
MGPRLHVCLIEDDPIMGESLCDRLELEGFGFDWCRSGGGALDRIASRSYGAVISDIRLPDYSGEELFRRVIERERFVPPWIFITAYGSIDRAVALLKLGAADYVTKPFDLDELIGKLSAAGRVPWRQPEEGQSAPMLGISPQMRQFEAMLPRLAAQASTVLVTGESGVGKEVVARLIHDSDARGRERQFVAVNCGGLPETLLEAELFGHEKGAFTGAVRQRRGVFEQADGGTLFLDEIGDMPAAMQIKLLRALQERKFTRIGGEGSIAVDLRVVCATHREMRKLVEQGAFREDLYYRIHVINLRIPPLRERPEDIMWHADRFLAEQAARRPTERKFLSRGAERALTGYPWPGNIRELRHCIERAWILTEGETLEAEALFEEASLHHISRYQAGDGLSDYLQACERMYLLRALERNHGQIGASAADLGISRKNLWEKMRKLEIGGRETSSRDNP